MAKTIVRILMRSDTQHNWEQEKPILGKGEIGYDSTVKNFKIGDGTTPWTDLDYFTKSESGDIVLNGTFWADLTLQKEANYETTPSFGTVKLNSKVVNKNINGQGDVISINGTESSVIEFYEKENTIIDKETKTNYKMVGKATLKAIKQDDTHIKSYRLNFTNEGNLPFDISIGNHLIITEKNIVVDDTKGKQTDDVPIIQRNDGKLYADNKNSTVVRNNGSSVDNALTRFDGTTGKIIQNSGVILEDNNNLRLKTWDDSTSAYNVCRGRCSNTPEETIIYTKIAYKSSTHMPIVRLYGYAYGLQAPIELKIGFYIFQGKLGWCGAISMGAWRPEIRLFKYTENEQEYVAIGLIGKCYFLGFQVDVQTSSLGKVNDKNILIDGWRIKFGKNSEHGLVPELGVDNCIKVPYKSTLEKLTINKTVYDGSKAVTMELPTKDDIGNGTITIKQEGIKDQAFTVNQKDNTTITLKNTLYNSGDGLTLTDDNTFIVNTDGIVDDVKQIYPIKLDNNKNLVVTVPWMNPDGVYLPLAGGTMTGPITIASGDGNGILFKDKTSNINIIDGNTRTLVGFLNNNFTLGYPAYNMNIRGYKLDIYSAGNAGFYLQGISTTTDYTKLGTQDPDRVFFIQPGDKGTLAVGGDVSKPDVQGNKSEKFIVYGNAKANKFITTENDGKHILMDNGDRKFVPDLELIRNAIKLTNESLDDIVKEGYYYAGGGNTCNKKPEGVDAFGMEVYRTAEGYVAQRITGANQKQNYIFIRTCSNKTSKTWSAWTRLLSDDVPLTLNSVSKDGVVLKGSGQNNKVWKTNDKGEPGWRPDQDTWLPNKVEQAGIVDAPGANANSLVWKTDAKGNPGWRTDKDTWIKNDASHDGYVIKGEGQKHKVWKTDENGTPAWREDANTWKLNTKASEGYVPAGENYGNSYWGTDSTGNPSWIAATDVDKNQFVTLHTDQTIDGQKTFTNTVYVNEKIRFKKTGNPLLDFPTNDGKHFYIQAFSNKMALGPTSTISTTWDLQGNMSVLGPQLTAKKIVKKDGAATEVLMADGSVTSVGSTAKDTTKKNYDVQKHSDGQLYVEVPWKTTPDPTGKYLPLTGSGNTSGTTDPASPMTGHIWFKNCDGIKIMSNNKDLNLWEIVGDAGKYDRICGFREFYSGKSSGNDNALNLYAGGYGTSAGTEILVRTITQNGVTHWKTKLYGDSGFFGNLTGHATSASRLYVENTDEVNIAYGYCRPSKDGDLYLNYKGAKEGFKVSTIVMCDGAEGSAHQAASASIRATGYKVQDKTNADVVLAGGGTKPIDDFIMEIEASAISNTDIDTILAKYN